MSAKPNTKEKSTNDANNKQKNSLGFNCPFDVHKDIDRTKCPLLIYIVNFINIATTDDYLLLFHRWAVARRPIVKFIHSRESMLRKSKQKFRCRCCGVRQWIVDVMDVPWRNCRMKKWENGWLVFIYFNNWWQMKISTSFHLLIAFTSRQNTNTSRAHSSFIASRRWTNIYIYRDIRSAALRLPSHLPVVFTFNSKAKTGPFTW